MHATNNWRIAMITLSKIVAEDARQVGRDITSKSIAGMFESIDILAEAQDDLDAEAKAIWTKKYRRLILASLLTGVLDITTVLMDKETNDVH
jgi:hypothetical protein